MCMSETRYPSPTPQLCQSTLEKLWLHSEGRRADLACRTVQLLPESLQGHENQGEHMGTCGTVETLDLPQAVQLEGLKQPRCE